MEELLARVTERTGLDAATATKAIGIILDFVKKEGPADEVNQLLAAVPGAEAAIAQADEGGSGIAGMMGALGGGVMALGGRLMGAGVSMGQMEPLGRELFAFAREKAGEDVVGPIVGAIPGLSQFV